MSKYFVWHDEPGSAGSDEYGHAWGSYEADTPGQARQEFLGEWGYEPGDWCQPLHIIKQRPCNTCNGTGIMPHEYHDDEDDLIKYFCVDCVMKYSRKRKS